VYSTPSDPPASTAISAPAPRRCRPSGSRGTPAITRRQPHRGRGLRARRTKGDRREHARDDRRDHRRVAARRQPERAVGDRPDQRGRAVRIGEVAPKLRHQAQDHAEEHLSSAAPQRRGARRDNDGKQRMRVRPRRFGGEEVCAQPLRPDGRGRSPADAISAVEKSSIPEAQAFGTRPSWARTTTRARTRPPASGARQAAIEDRADRNLRRLRRRADRLTGARGGLVGG
jgi:hypothetical protein